MIWLYAVLACAMVLLGGRLVLHADPGRLAATLRVVLPLALCASGMVLTALGRPFIGFPLVGLAVGWGLYQFARPRRRPPRAKPSTVRTAALEMEVHPGTGALEGIILAGRHEGRMLGTLDRRALSALRRELASDPDSVRLLETYLESRFPARRVDGKADVGARKTGAPAPRAMTEKEAYKVLGLEPGASAADIRQAHRRLVKGLGTDVGSPSVLAARIDQARDFLLSMHG